MRDQQDRQKTQHDLHSRECEGLFLPNKCGFAICEKALVGFLELLLEFKVRCLTKFEWATESCGADM